MARNDKETTGWGFRLVALLLTLAVVVVVFALSFSNTGNELKSMLRSATPVGSGILVSYALGSIRKLSHRRWQIYVAVLLIAAVIVGLRSLGVF